MKNPFKREPDFYVGGKQNPYMMRWWIIPRNRYFNIYLHKFLRDDEDRACHSHPWKSLSIILKGNYIEHRPVKFVNRRTGKIEIVDYERQVFKRWAIIPRAANYFHRIELFKEYYDKIAADTAKYYEENCPEKNPYVKFSQPVWTIFITGRKIQEWHFLCPQGLVHWKDFVDETDEGNIGKGCAE